MKGIMDLTVENEEPVLDENNISISIGEDYDGERLDQHITDNTNIPSRSAVQNLIKNGNVLVDGKKAKKNQKLSLGQVIEIDISPLKETPVVGEDIPIKIAYEDDDIIVIDKAAGMVTHPAVGNKTGTLVNALLFHTRLAASSDNSRPGIVHRLDKDTSGLLVAAKNIESYDSLVLQMKNREIKRAYKVLVEGNFKEASGEIIAPIARDLYDRQKMAVSTSGGKEAVTGFKVLDNFNGTAYLEATLLTGRTHQIRVHLGYIKHKVVGDYVYGTTKFNKSAGLGRQFLHAWRLSFAHPINGSVIDIKSELPKDLEEALKYFKNIKNLFDNQV